MADSATKTGKVKQMPGAQKAPAPPATAPGNGFTPVSGEVIPTAANQEPPTPFDAPGDAEPEPKRRGRPPKDSIMSGGVGGNKPILELIADVPARMWPELAKVKIYRLAPIINRNATSEFRYISEFTEPVTAQRLKTECGSGNYRLYLNLKNQNGMGEREAARGEVKILDPAYPPKIPMGEWVDDPRNREWSWAKPQPVAPAPAGPAIDSILEGIKLSNEIRKDAREELRATAPAAPAPTQQGSPILEGLAIAEKLLALKADNPMVEIMKAQLATMQASLDKAAERQERLEKELRDSRTPAQAQAAPKGLVEQLVELGNNMEALNKTPLGKLFSFGAPAAEAPAPVVRSRLTPTMEFFKDVVPSIVEPFKPLIGAFAQKMMAPPSQPGVAGIGPRPPAGRPAGELPLLDFIDQTLLDPLIGYLDDEATGANFALFVFNGWPNRLSAIQNLEHPQLPGKRGAPVIIELMKHTSKWSQIAYRQDQFEKFILDFCAWKPDADQAQPAERAQEPDTAEPGVTEIEFEDAENEFDSTANHEGGEGAELEKEMRG